jgi:hypothetical protein
VPRSGPLTELLAPSVERAVQHATRLLTKPAADLEARDLALSVLWLADQLDQTQLALEAALGREDVREARPANTAGTRGGDA